MTPPNWLKMVENRLSLKFTKISDKKYKILKKCLAVYCSMIIFKLFTESKKLARSLP